MTDTLTKRLSDATNAITALYTDAFALAQEHAFALDALKAENVEFKERVRVLEEIIARLERTTVTP